MAYFAEFLNLTGLYRLWVEGCPLRYASPNGSRIGDVLGTPPSTATSATAFSPRHARCEPRSRRLPAHIQDLIARINSYTAGGEAAFKADRKTQDAVLHNLEIIGQCVRDYGVDDLTAACPEIPWAQIAAFRNVLAHKYLGVDLDLVWGIVQRDIPPLARQVEVVLHNAAGPDSPI